MHGTTRTRTLERPSETGVNAVVWIEPGRAVVVRGGDQVPASSTEVPLPSLAAITPPALAEVAHSIGEVDHVLVLGRDDLRTALEREIVAIGHRPEIIREAATDGTPDEAALVARLASIR